MRDRSTGTDNLFYPAEVLALDSQGEPIFARAWISEFGTTIATMSCDQELKPGQRIDLRIKCSDRTIPVMFRAEEPLDALPVLIRAQAEVIGPLERVGSVYEYSLSIRFLGHFNIIHAVEPQSFG